MLSTQCTSERFSIRNRDFITKSDKKLYNIDVQKSTSTPPNKYISIIKCIENKIWQRNYSANCSFTMQWKIETKKNPLSMYDDSQKKAEKIASCPNFLLQTRPPKTDIHSSFIYWLVMQIPTHNNSTSSPNVASNTLALLSKQTTQKVNSHHFHKTFYPPPTKDRVSQHIVKHEKLQKNNSTFHKLTAIQKCWNEL